jgi:2-polyprenyl-3-methyl-5-hydroxy-6-metoxy-1,4-benzoquinol methylase
MITQNRIKILSSLVDEFENINSKSLLTPYNNNLHKKILNIINPEYNYNSIENLQENLELIKRMTLLNSQIHFETEMEIANSILDGKDFVLKKTIFNKGFEQILKNIFPILENNKININQSKVIFVGCGPLPQTVIYFASKGINIDSIDSSEQAVEIGNNVLNKLGLNKSKIIEAEANKFDYCDYNIVITATMLIKKEEAFKRIFETSKSILIVRNPVGLNRFWREYINNEKILDLGWRLVDILEPKNSSLSLNLYTNI